MRAVTGADKLARRLHMHMAGIRRGAESAVEACAEQALQRARANAPVRTGRLRNSLARAGGRVYTSCSYAAHVEWGGVHTPPRPFLSAAADEEEYCRMAAEQMKEAVL